MAARAFNNSPGKKKKKKSKKQKRREKKEKKAKEKEKQQKMDREKEEEEEEDNGELDEWSAGEGDTTRFNDSTFYCKVADDSGC